MKGHPWKSVVMALVVAGLVATAQPALAWVRVGIDLRIPFPVVAVAPAPVVYAPPRPAYYQPAVYYGPIWVPGHYNRWGVWVRGHRR